MSRVLASIICSGLCSVALALDLDQQKQFDIPAQKLTTALVAFSRQASAPIVSATKEVARFSSPGVMGRMTLKEALKALLVGTGLDIRTTENGAIAVGVFSANPGNTGGARNGFQGSTLADRLPPAKANTPEIPGAGADTPQDNGSSDRAADLKKLLLTEIVVTGSRIPLLAGQQ